MSIFTDMLKWKAATIRSQLDTGNEPSWTVYKRIVKKIYGKSSTWKQVGTFTPQVGGQFCVRVLATSAHFSNRGAYTIEVRQADGTIVGSINVTSLQNNYQYTEMIDMPAFTTYYVYVLNEMYGDDITFDIGAMCFVDISDMFVKAKEGADE